jgi:hypothetical protein
VNQDRGSYDERVPFLNEGSNTDRSPVGCHSVRIGVNDQSFKAHREESISLHMLSKKKNLVDLLYRGCKALLRTKLIVFPYLWPVEIARGRSPIVNFP